MTVKRWIIAAVTFVVVAAVGGPYVFFHVVSGKAAPKLTLAPSTPGASGGSGGGVDGTWKVANGSVVQYRVHELLFGQSNEATGATNSITGSLTVKGTSISAAFFNVTMTT